MEPSDFGFGDELPFVSLNNDELSTILNSCSTSHATHNFQNLEFDLFATQEDKYNSDLDISELYL